MKTEIQPVFIGKCGDCPISYCRIDHNRNSSDTCIMKKEIKFPEDIFDEWMLEYDRILEEKNKECKKIFTEIYIRFKGIPNLKLLTREYDASMDKIYLRFTRNDDIPTYPGDIEDYELWKKVPDEHRIFIRKHNQYNCEKYGKPGWQFIERFKGIIVA